MRVRRGHAHLPQPVRKGQAYHSILGPVSGLVIAADLRKARIAFATQVSLNQLIWLRKSFVYVSENLKQ